MHPWNLTVEEAEILQKSLAEDCILEGDPDVETIAGIDISMAPESELAIASVVLYSIDRQAILQEIVLLGDLTFPYVPGLLAFREAPLMLQALMLLDREPDCLLVDGHGYAHPRRFGLASHLGLLMELPSIGCAKSILVGEHDVPGTSRGSFTDIWDGEPIGYALRSSENANPIFLSPGHRISRENILPIVRDVIDGTSKLPVPVHQAHKLAKNQHHCLKSLTSPFIEFESGVFLIGGALRDLLSGRKPTDYDLLVTDFPEDVRSKLSDEFDSHFFDLDVDRNMHRMVADELQLDVIVIDEDQVVSNLENRDFTINSIALDMNRESWVDPVSGRDDIKRNLIRPSQRESLTTDPVRVLRGYRFATVLNFEFTDDFTDQITDVASELTNASLERIVDELFKIFSLEELIQCLRCMNKDGVIEAVEAFRSSVISELETVTHWVPVLEGYELFQGDYHGGYSLLTGFEVGRLITEDAIKNWPLHQRIKTLTLSSHQSLPEVPKFDLLDESRWKLIGRLLGRGVRDEWSSELIGEGISRLQRYLKDRELLEKDIVDELTDNGVDETSIGKHKKKKLKQELPGLWENRLTPILNHVRGDDPAERSQED